MQIALHKAAIKDTEEVHRLQIAAFAELLCKYQDYETNPGAEPLSKITERMQMDHNDYYFIKLDEINIGCIRIKRKQDAIHRISQMFILPQYQGNGYAQEAIKLAEALYPEASHWELDTIKEEVKLCHLYEKMGYQKTGRETKLKDGMTLVDYIKE